MDKGIVVKTTKGTFELKEEDFSDFGVSICLPEVLTDLSDEERTNKVITTGEPDLIRTDLSNGIVFTISSSPAEIKEGIYDNEAVEGFMSAQHKIISRLTPGYLEYGMKIKQIESHTIACLRFKSNAIDDDMYNIFYLFIHKGKMIFGTFSCILDDQAEWELVFLTCLDTLKFK